ncbi:MAG: hypothetical protein J6D54_05050 [Olsenella sp.]|nr:hypothetical protein [Olsenella sp.]
MRTERANHAATMMARLPGVSALGFYAWLKRGEDDDPWVALKAEMERVGLRRRRSRDTESCGS